MIARPLETMPADRDEQPMPKLPLQPDHRSEAEIIAANQAAERTSSRRPLFCAIARNDASGVQSLITRFGHDANEEDESGRSASFFAALSGTPGCLAVLILLGADLETGCLRMGGITPLIAASGSGFTSCVEQIIVAGVWLDRKSRGGFTAATHASAKGQVRCLEMLLKAGVGVNQTNSQSGTLLFLAAQNDHDASSLCLSPQAPI
jgi:ankyrin repeat protein